MGVGADVMDGRGIVVSVGGGVLVRTGVFNGEGIIVAVSVPGKMSISSWVGTIIDPGICCIKLQEIMKMMNNTIQRYFIAYPSKSFNFGF
jgi:hypothetical protein